MIDRAYHNLHYWVRQTLGTPQLCDNCGAADPQYKYEWANISGEYLQDSSDWVRLCKLCHNLIDHSYHRPTHCKRGHLLTPENTKVAANKNKGRVYLSRNCKTCARDWSREYQRVHQKEYRARRKEFAL